MRQYEVTFTVYADEHKNRSSSSMTSIKTVVAASNPDQARKMIESMHGGSRVVSVFSAVEKR